MFSYSNPPKFTKGQRVVVKDEYMLGGYWLREGDTALVVEDSSNILHSTRVAFDNHMSMAGAYADEIPTRLLEAVS